MQTFIFLGLIINVFRRMDNPQGLQPWKYEKCGYCMWRNWWAPNSGNCSSSSLEERGCKPWLLISRKGVDSRLSSRYPSLNFVAMRCSLDQDTLGILKFFVGLFHLTSGPKDFIRK